MCKGPEAGRKFVYWADKRANVTRAKEVAKVHRSNHSGFWRLRGVFLPGHQVSFLLPFPLSPVAQPGEYSRGSLSPAEWINEHCQRWVSEWEEGGQKGLLQNP